MKKKLLILDDKEPIARVLRIYLSTEFQVVWKTDGQQGLDWLKEGNFPDLILCDIKMPNMRGDEFLKHIKNMENFKEIPIVILSSEDSTSERKELLEKGAADYIVKPFNPMELKARIMKLF